MKWNFRNLLAIVSQAEIIAIWILQGLGLITLPGEVIGALISIFTLVFQFYFRKKPEGEPVEQ